MSDSPQPRLAELIARAIDADGHPPFSDGALVAVAQGRAAVQWLDSAAAIVTEGASFDGVTLPPPVAEFVVDPDARRAGQGTRMFHRLAAAASGDLLFWAHGDHPGARAIAARHGATPARRLLRMMAELPRPPRSPVPNLPNNTPLPKRRSFGPIRSEFAQLPEETAQISVISEGGTGIGPEGGTGSEGGTGRDGGRDTAAVGTAMAGEIAVTIRGFDPDRDADAWVALNARAFARHPEQGAITRTDLATLMGEPWFDRDDLLVAEQGGRMVAFCWLKTAVGSESSREGETGELYAVGVDPDSQRTGLGRLVVATGLERLAARGIRTAHLYVEGDNAAAIALYDSFGFATSDVDVQYLWRNAPARRIHKHTL